MQFCIYVQITPTFTCESVFLDMPLFRATRNCRVLWTFNTWFLITCNWLTLIMLVPLQYPFIQLGMSHSDLAYTCMAPKQRATITHSLPRKKCIIQDLIISRLLDFKNQSVITWKCQELINECHHRMPFIYIQPWIQTKFSPEAMPFPAGC